MRIYVFLLFMTFFSLKCFGEEIDNSTRDLGPKSQTEDEKLEVQYKFIPSNSPLKKPSEKTDFVFHNRSLLGSNFSYGNSSWYDISVHTESSLKLLKHKLENELKYYSYYYHDAYTPTQRFKGLFNASLKYLYEITPNWSPFAAYKYEQTFERKGIERHNNESHNIDLGLRYDNYFEEKSLYLSIEASHRLIVENSHDFKGNSHNLRVYTGIYYNSNHFGAGISLEATAPYSDMENYTLNIDPDINYTFPGTSFFIGLTASARWNGVPDYLGDSRFNIWSGSFYAGFKI